MEKYRHEFGEGPAEGGAPRFRAGRILAGVDFLAPDVFRVFLYREGDRLLPTWNVAPGDTPMPPEGRPRLSAEGFPLAVPAERRECLAVPDAMGNRERRIFSLPAADVVIGLPRFTVEVRRDGKTLWADRPLSPYNYAGELGEGSAHFLTAEPGEKIFGLGEKSGGIDREGRSFELGARDAMGYDASSTDPLYKHLPFYICQNSVGAYGILYDTHARGRFNFTEELDNYYGRFKSFVSEDPVLVYYVFLGSVRDIARNFFRTTGRPAMPPRWSLDYCGSTMAYTDAPDAEARLQGFLASCEAMGLRVSGFYLSSGYTSIGARRYVFHWNRDKFPDPDGLFRRFREAGVHLLPNVKPAFLEDHPLYGEIARRGWFLHYADGSPARIPFWDGYGSYLDFTNREAFAFWTECVRRELTDRGADALWNDNNEYHLTDREILADGFGRPVPAYRICQVFPMLMAMASAAAFPRDGKRHLMSTRSGGAGLHRLCQTWTGDNRTSFRDLRYNHLMGLGMNLSGLPLAGHDLGGFAGERPSPELLMRWLQYGVFLPRFCVHSWNADGSATEPWMYPEYREAVRRLFALRYRLTPYLYAQLHRVCREWDTFLTPLFLDYPGEDPAADTFLTGHDLLCGCVFDEGAVETVLRVPAGLWYRDGTDECFTEGTYRLPLPVDGLPVILHRAGSVFPEPAEPYGRGADTGRVRYRFYAPDEGTVEAGFTEDDGESLTDADAGTVRLRIVCGEVISVEGTLEGGRLSVTDRRGRRVVYGNASVEKR